MDDEKNLFYRAKSIFSSLYGIILWSTTLPSSRQISKQHWTASRGLKTLINPTHHPFIIHSCKKSSPSSLLLSYSSSYSSCSTLDDVIGTESGVCLKSSVEESDIKHYNILGKRNDQQRCLIMRNKYLAGHTPWNLTRHYSNGRLILKEERLEHHEYFESHRENGRLILKLIRVPLDDKVHDLAYDEEKCIEEELMHEKLMATSASCMPKSYLENGSERHGDLRKCFTYAGKMISANVQRKGDAYMPQSSTLTFTNIRPMTTVV